MKVFGPKKADHPSVGQICPACFFAFEPGDYTALVPIGPGPSKDARRWRREGKPYTAVAVELHYACATGIKGEDAAKERDAAQGKKLKADG